MSGVMLLLAGLRGCLGVVHGFLLRLLRVDLGGYLVARPLDEANRLGGILILCRSCTQTIMRLMLRLGRPVLQ